MASTCARAAKSSWSVSTSSVSLQHPVRCGQHRRDDCCLRRTKLGSKCHAAQEVAAWDDGRPTKTIQQLISLYKFSRPHTMLGTLLSVCSVSAMAMHGQPWSQQAWAALWTALTSALMANVSIVGINQCFDIHIDRVNKPYLPLASGEWPLSTGWAVVTVTGVLALATALASASWPLILTVGASILLGIVYSVDLPLLRWKKNPLAAAACILTVRAVLVQVCFQAPAALVVLIEKMC
jgi:4-hydroxybenzoate polyprenyltransferase